MINVGSTGGYPFEFPIPNGCTIGAMKGGYL